MPDDWFWWGREIWLWTSKYSHFLLVHSKWEESIQISKNKKVYSQCPKSQGVLTLTFYFYVHCILDRMSLRYATHSLLTSAGWLIWTTEENLAFSESIKTFSLIKSCRSEENPFRGGSMRLNRRSTVSAPSSPKAFDRGRIIFRVIVSISYILGFEFPKPNLWKRQNDSLRVQFYCTETFFHNLSTPNNLKSRWRKGKMSNKSIISGITFLQNAATTDSEDVCEWWAASPRSCPPAPLLVSSVCQ